MYLLQNIWGCPCAKSDPWTCENGFILGNWSCTLTVCTVLLSQRLEAQINSTRSPPLRGENKKQNEYIRVRSKPPNWHFARFWNMVLTTSLYVNGCKPLLKTRKIVDFWMWFWRHSSVNGCEANRQIGILLDATRATILRCQSDQSDHPKVSERPERPS